jgi:radical SAM superfamily enzyme YgiQ (UPF0313 family)
LKPNPNVLFIYPKFTAQSFWNFKETCELVGRKYPTSPLGLITVAAMLPPSWQAKLIDLNVDKLTSKHEQWADLVFIGGMIFQQPDHLRLIRHFKSLGKRVVVGGPDPTSSPHIYEEADHLVLGEAEVTFDPFLDDYQSGVAKHLYSPGDKKADMRKSPLPRFEMLNFKNYLHIGIQWNRGCPFMCEFCDIIELFGRVPRGKGVGQVLLELQKLYELGYRGHVEIVDDNFIGNKKSVKELLPHLADWQEKHRYPFDFSTEASLNLSDDEPLMKMMRKAGFSWIFTGIETPNEDTLKSTQKHQNTRRSIAESVRLINQEGMIVHAGYIVGFDQDITGSAQALLQNIEDTSIPVSMVGLLYALPNTQLTRRLKKEGRLGKHFDVPMDQATCQCTTGLNFTTLRSRLEILKDFRRVVSETFSADKYFGRVKRLAMQLNCKGRELNLPLSNRIREAKAFITLPFKLGFQKGLRRLYFSVIFACLFQNPRALNNAISLMALYLHFGKFRVEVLAKLDVEIALLKREAEETQQKAAKVVRETLRVPLVAH